MKKVLLFSVLTALLSSCSPKVTTLYYWGGGNYQCSMYEAFAYLSYDKQTHKNLCRLICVYEDMVSRPIGTRQVPPPGICAEYGYLLLQPQTAEIFLETASYKQKKAFGEQPSYEALFKERGREMFEKEMELYPESVPFIKPLFEKLIKQQ